MLGELRCPDVTAMIHWDWDGGNWPGGYTKEEEVLERTIRGEVDVTEGEAGVTGSQQDSEA